MPSNNAAYNLGNAVTQLFLGNPAARQDNYLKGQLMGWQASERMAAARKGRADAMIAEDQLNQRQTGVTEDALVANGFTPAQARLAVGMLRGNATMNMANLGDFANPVRMQAYQDASKAVGLGDMVTANRHLALAKGDPLETTTVDANGQVYNKYADPSQGIGLTRLGDAVVVDKRASAGAHNAVANAANAHAGLYRTQTEAGGWNPNAGGGEGGQPSLPPVSAMAAMLGKDYNEDTGLSDVDSEAVRAIYDWQARTPGMQNGAVALQNWPSKGPVGAQGTLPPKGAIALGRLGDMVTHPRGVTAKPAATRKVVRTGTQSGRKVVQYEDGSIDYAD